jgi:predicted transcriptional regulator
MAESVEQRHQLLLKLDRGGDARAEADFAAGRVFSHEQVKAWLQSWGTENPLPRPQLDVPQQCQPLSPSC